MGTDREPITVEEWKAAYFRMMESRDDALAGVQAAVAAERERCILIAGGRTRDRIRDQYTGEVTVYERQMTQHEIVAALRQKGTEYDTI